MSTLEPFGFDEGDRLSGGDAILFKGVQLTNEQQIAAVIKDQLYLIARVVQRHAIEQEAELIKCFEAEQDIRVRSFEYEDRPEVAAGIAAFTFEDAAALQKSLSVSFYTNDKDRARSEQALLRRHTRIHDRVRDALARFRGIASRGRLEYRYSTETERVMRQDDKRRVRRHGHKGAL